MTTGNGNRNWRERLGLQDRNEQLPKLADQFGDAGSGAPSSLAGGPGKDMVAVAPTAKERGSKGERRRIPPPPPPPISSSRPSRPLLPSRPLRSSPPADDEPESTGPRFDNLPSPLPGHERLSPAARTFAERLRARREATTQTASTDPGDRSPPRLSEEVGGKSAAADRLTESGVRPSSRLISSPSQVGEDLGTPVGDAGTMLEPGEEAAMEPLFVPIPPRERSAERTFERARFRADLQGRDDRDAEPPRGGVPLPSSEADPSRRSPVAEKSASLRTGGAPFDARSPEPGRTEVESVHPIRSDHSGGRVADAPTHEDDRHEGGHDASYRGEHASDTDRADDDHAEKAWSPSEETGGHVASGYSDYEDVPHDERYEYGELRRPRVPWLLFAGLACVGGIAATLIWFYLQPRQGDVFHGAEPPVISAPKAKVKVEPPKELTVPATRQTKLFYDRIVGEDTVEEEKLVPREEQPLDPGASLTTPNDGGNSVEPQPLQPPAPDRGDDNELPLPVPPPGSSSNRSEPAGSSATDVGQSGSPSNTTSVAKIDRNTTTVEPAGLTKVLPPSSSRSGSGKTGDVPRLQPPKAVDAQVEAVAEPAAADPPTETVGTDARDGTVAAIPLPQPLPKPRTVPSVTEDQSEEPADASAPSGAAASTESSSVTPLPESRPQENAPDGGAAVPNIAPAPGNPSREDTQNDGAPALDVAVAPESRPRENASGGGALALDITPAPGNRLRPRVLPNRTSEAGRNVSPSASDLQRDGQATQGRQVAAVSPAPRTATPAVGSGAYVVQLASYRDEAAALEGYRQLRVRHPSLLDSYRPLISKREVGNFGTFYRLQIGPIVGASSGDRICALLLAAGEKDCLVKRR